MIIQTLDDLYRAIDTYIGKEVRVRSASVDLYPILLDTSRDQPRLVGAAHPQISLHTNHGVFLIMPPFEILEMEEVSQDAATATS